MMTMSAKGATKLNISEALLGMPPRPWAKAWVNKVFSFRGLRPLGGQIALDLRRDYSQRGRESNGGPLEHVPKKLHDFFDQNMLQHYELARFLIDQTIPSDR